MKIAVIDGQGGGIGRIIVEKLKDNIPQSDILALGTNAAATANMIKAGANRGATGENAIIYNADKVDIIMGALGIIAASAMLGEISEKIAGAISTSDAVKILIPLGMCNLEIAGIDENISIQKLIDIAIERVKNRK